MHLLVYLERRFIYLFIWPAESIYLDLFMLSDSLLISSHSLILFHC